MSEKTFKSARYSALGQSNVEKVAIGDIVTWKSWEISLNDEVFEVKEGLLVDVFEAKRGLNDVFIAKILPFGAEKHVELPLISIKKSTKKDYL
jgi:hypothetical protein